MIINIEKAAFLLHNTTKVQMKGCPMRLKIIPCLN